MVDRLTGRAELRAIGRSLRDAAAAQQQQSVALQSRLAALADLVDQRSTAKDANEIFHALRALATTVEEGLAGSSSADDRPSTAALFRALDDVARADGPIVVGPWTGEVGFEILYWIPFVRWFVLRWRVPADRLVIVSRGGVAAWYGLPGARYVDAFSLVSVPVFREGAGWDKQRRVSDFDRELVAAAGGAGAGHLHPHLMYRALGPFWKEEAGLGLMARFTKHRRIEPPDDPVLRSLPADYVAVRFYFSNCFPDKPENRALARAVVEALAQRTPVVVLPGVRVDDHAVYAPPQAGAVITLPPPPPERNLAVQTALLGRARAFVGTYGGYAYVAPFLGVSSIGFYSHPSFKFHHLYAAQRALEQLGTATITALHAADAGLVQAATAWAADAAPHLPGTATA